ncbi:uncharacterized protein BXZ73DRAFT_105577 [Epithele typhae]|uniref:uncharacterized protein n=1 Tax=Epithele typhae TaxID=378194 RepID=UPI00200731F7|nr:uncharacterized protein BXZ73DRAFT_105577 [Epithele typhae]KAH9917097.1 hypothetical protein BXZ73DRAFT_105577 [Epithele typhae]
MKPPTPAPPSPPPRVSEAGQPQRRSCTDGSRGVSHGEPTTDVARAGPLSARTGEDARPNIAGRPLDSIGRRQTTTFGVTTSAQAVARTSLPLARADEGTADGRCGSNGVRSPAASTPSGPTVGQKPSIVRSSRLIIPPLPQPAASPPSTLPPPPSVPPPPSALSSSPSALPPSPSPGLPPSSSCTISHAPPPIPPPHTRPQIKHVRPSPASVPPPPSASRPLPIPPAPPASVPASHLGVPIGHVPDAPPNTRPLSGTSYASGWSGGTDSRSDGTGASVYGTPLTSPEVGTHALKPARTLVPATFHTLHPDTRHPQAASHGTAPAPAPVPAPVSVVAAPAVPPPAVPVTPAPAPVAVPPESIARILASFPAPRWNVRHRPTAAFLRDDRFRQTAFAAGLTKCQVVFNADSPDERFIATCKASHNGNPLTVADVLRGIGEKLAGTPHVGAEEPSTVRAANRRRAGGAEGPITYADFVKTNVYFFLGLRETTVPGEFAVVLGDQF